MNIRDAQSPKFLTGALLGQIVVVVSNLCAGVVLARGMPLETRGLSALANVATSISGLIGGLGLSELLIRHHARFVFRRRTVSLAVTISVGVGLATGAVFIAVLGISFSQASLIALICVFSSQNSWALARLYCESGILAFAVAQALFASMVALTTATTYIASAWSLTFTQVLVVLLLCELFLLSWCARKHYTNHQVLSRSLLGLDWDSASISSPNSTWFDLRSGVLHLFSQLGSIAGDRGIVLLASGLGGLTSAAQLSVAQSIASPVNLPVQALSPSLIREGSVARQGGKWTKASQALTCSTIISVIGLGLAPILTIPIFGAQYRDLATDSWLIMLVGLAGAAWRIWHLKLRGAHLPAKAFQSDMIAFGVTCCFAWFAFTSKDATLSLLLVLAAYSTVGCVSARLLYKVFRPNSSELLTLRAKL